jgi:hypothetical protein
MHPDTFSGQLRDPALVSPDQSHSFVAATLELSTQGICAKPEGHPPRLLAWSGMRMRKNDGGALEFYQGGLTVSSSDPDILRVVESLAGNDLGNDISRVHGDTVSGPWRTRLGCVAFVAFCVWALLKIPACFSAVTDGVADSVPYSADETIGELADKSMPTNGTEITDSQVRGAIEVMLNRIAPYRCLPDAEFKFKVVRNPTINAFALPGGYITVFSGLIEKATSPEQVAGVLAHEIAHVTKRHGINRIVKAAGAATVLAVTVGDMGGLQSAAMEVLTAVTMNGYGRSDESEADQEGVRMLIAARIDPEGLAEFFETLEEEQDGELPVWMSTHPKPGGRAQAVRDQVFELSSTPDWEPLDIDWEAIIERIDQA